MAALTWLVIIGLAAVGYKYLLHPTVEKRLHSRTGSSSQYQHEVRLALDSFSGYCLLRSDALGERLKKQGIRLVVEDDGADIPGRLKAMRSGDIDLAVFTIDSLLLAGAESGSFPGSMILVLDETRGADALVAYEQAVPSLDALNHADARIVATPASPSEFLARVAVANFNLPALPDAWLEPEDGAEAVYKAFRASRPDRPRAYALWEPYVSRALEEPGAKILLDSSQLSGYIMDVLVARREFLRDHEDVARQIVEAYLRTAYQVDRSGSMVDLVVDDARRSGTQGIRKAQAAQLVSGIAWRNTLENYVQFGLIRAEGEGLPHLEDAIHRISDVLRRTGAMSVDPLNGQANILFYDKILRDLKASRFHPGKALNLLDPDSGEDLGFETVRAAPTLPALSEEEWASLAPAGEMRIEPLSFGRGGARLTLSSQRNLTLLAEQLEAFPEYYLTVVGHARAEGDADANLQLARMRAEAARNFLLEQGLNPNRVGARGAPSEQRDAAAQSVSFVVGQLPY